jgi:hypothetical protein
MCCAPATSEPSLVEGVELDGSWASSGTFSWSCSFSPWGNALLAPLVRDLCATGARRVRETVCPTLDPVLGRTVADRFGLPERPQHPLRGLRKCY